MEEFAGAVFLPIPLGYYHKLWIDIDLLTRTQPRRFIISALLQPLLLFCVIFTIFLVFLATRLCRFTFHCKVKQDSPSSSSSSSSSFWLIESILPVCVCIDSATTPTTENCKSHPLGYFQLSMKGGGGQLRIVLRTADRGGGKETGRGRDRMQNRETKRESS